MSPWRIRLAARLADGEWHDLDELAADAGALIPPGRGLRANEANRARLTPNPRSQPLPVDARVASGRRAIIRVALRDMVRSGAAVTDPGPPRRWKDANRG